MEGKYLCRKCLCARESREWEATKKEESGEKRGRESDRERVNESSRREKKTRPVTEGLRDQSDIN